MATSGVTIWQPTRDNIINAALRKLTVLSEGQVANAQQLSDGSEALNAIIMEYQTLGLQLWSRIETDITLVPLQATYTIGVGQAINIPFPLKLLQANLAIPNAATNLNMDILSRYNYNNLPSGTGNTGMPVQVLYEPFINYGILTPWPTPDSSVPLGTKIKLTYIRPFDIYTSGTETMYFPQEWTNALIYQLALSLADEYALPIPDRQWYEKQAEKHLNTALSFGSEEGSFLIYPEYRW